MVHNLRFSMSDRM